MRTYISVDAEGISGIVKLNQVVPGRPDYAFCRKMMTHDVNAAVRGALNGGATEVVVNDAHNLGDNIFIDQLDPSVKLISGADRPFSMMQGVEKGFDAALLIGYHSRKGELGVISHTYYYGSVMEVTINGKPVAEYEINGLLAGYFGVPVVFVSGDDKLVEDAQKNIPSVYSVITKEAVGHGSALCYHPELTHRRIAETVEKALRNYERDNIEPMRVPVGSIELGIMFTTPGYAAYASWIPGVELVAPNRVRYVADDYLQIFKGLISALHLSSAYREA